MGDCIVGEAAELPSWKCYESQMGRTPSFFRLSSGSCLSFLFDPFFCFFETIGTPIHVSMMKPTKINCALEIDIKLNGESILEVFIVVDIIADKNRGCGGKII